MGKHLVLLRDPNGDWYTQAQNFLAANKRPPLHMIVTDQDPKSNAFLNAAAQIVSNTGDTMEIGPGVMVVMSSDIAIMESDGSESVVSRCECRCGGNYSTCGGGGGGH